jgi:hypothetical protein
LPAHRDSQDKVRAIAFDSWPRGDYIPFSALGESLYRNIPIAMLTKLENSYAAPRKNQRERKSRNYLASDYATFGIRRPRYLLKPGARARRRCSTQPRRPSISLGVYAPAVANQDHTEATASAAVVDADGNSDPQAGIENNPGPEPETTTDPVTKVVC